MTTILGLIASGFAFIALLAFYMKPGWFGLTSKPTDKSSLDQTILVECFWSQFPTAVPSYGLYYWELTFSAGDGAFLSTSQQPGSTITWDLGQPGHWEACQFTNFSNTPIIRMEAVFRLQYLEVVAQENGTRSGNVILSKEIPNPPVRLGVGDKNTFIFYMRNRSSYYAQVVVPETAKVQVAGADELQTVRLIPPTVMKNVANMPPYTPTNPPAAIPQVPAPPIKPQIK